MRTLNSGKNFLVTISLMVTMTLLGFVTRKLFVNEIGVEYLGLNGLLTNILAAVTLLAAGISSKADEFRPWPAETVPALALSQLDGPTARVVRDRLAALPGPTTVIEVTHRVDLIDDATFVAVLDAGRLVASGTAAALRRDNEAFALLEARGA